jgi:hypothetical protein
VNEISEGIAAGCQVRDQVLACPPGQLGIDCEIPFVEIRNGVIQEIGTELHPLTGLFKSARH